MEARPLCCTGMPVRGLIFDLFDTLIDLRFEDLEVIDIGGRRLPASVKALYQAVARRAEVDFERFAEAMFAVDREARDSHYAEGRELPTFERFAGVAARLGIAAADLPAEMTEIHMGTLRSVSVAPDHHAGLLAELRQRARLGLCSNFSHAETALRLLDESSMRAHLEAVAISETVGLRKPRREIFEAVLGDLDAAPGEVLHVGDSLRADVGGAAALGIRTVWITRRVRDPEQSLREHTGPPPDWRIADLAELPRVLDEA